MAPGGFSIFLVCSRQLDARTCVDNAKAWNTPRIPSEVAVVLAS